MHIAQVVDIDITQLSAKEEYLQLLVSIIYYHLVSHGKIQHRISVKR